MPATEEAPLGLVSVVTVNPAGGATGCSGVLLSNSWGLTAGHCLDAVSGSTTRVTAQGVPGVFTMNALYKFGTHAGDATGPDIGLFRLSTPMPIQGSTTGFATRLNRTRPVGKSVTVYGRSTGSYLKTTSTVQSASGRNLVLKANETGSTTTQGDSGGPTYLVQNGQVSLVGITSTSNGTVAAIDLAADWILAATQTFLDQQQPFDATIVKRTEIAEQPEGHRFGSSSALVGRDGASVQRTVTLMCVKRGFIGGTLVPNLNAADGVLQIVCIGRSGGVQRLVSQAQLDQTGFGFADLDNTPWAQAARAATALCALQNNTLGGFFDGYSVGAEKSLVCIRAAAGEASVADARALPRLGDANLDEVDWLHARAAVSAYCEYFGFVGGFASGAQSPGQRPLTCVGRKDLALGGFGPPAAIGQTPRALYAVNIDEPLLAPPGAASDIGLTFKDCHSRLTSTPACAVTPEFEQWAYNATTRQLLHAKSGRCVNISGASLAADALVILFPCSNAPNEKWTVLRAAPSIDRWRIQSDHSGLCLTAVAGRRLHADADGLVRGSVANLTLRPCDGSDSQLFANVDADFWRRIAPH